jgi:hypothetical protein
MGIDSTFCMTAFACISPSTTLSSLPTCKHEEHVFEFEIQIQISTHCLSEAQQHS